MPINITTLHDSAMDEMTFTLISKDRATSEWINSTRSSTSRDDRLSISQSLIGKNKSGHPIRRSLVKYKITMPVSNPTTPGSTEEAVVNITLTAPTVSTVLTEAMLADAVYAAKDLLTATNIAALRQGQV